MNRQRVLVSMPTKHHVEIAYDEMLGLQELGFTCQSFDYAAKKGADSAPARLLVIFQNAIKLARLAQSFKPDIIYFNSRLEKLAGVRDFLTIAICKAFYHKRVAFIIKSHGSDIDVLNRKGYMLKNIVLPFLRKNVSAWLFLSSEEKEQLSSKKYFDSHKIYVTKNIVRVDQFQKDPHFKYKLGIPQDYKVLLFVGRVIEEKGVIEVVKAFSAINKDHKIALIIVGEGSAIGQVKEIIDKDNLRRNVILTGFIPEQEVVRYYANSDLLVFPTYFPEGFPMALFNAIGAGMAVITTKIRAANDYLTEPENCLWVNPKDSTSVVSAMEILLQSEQMILDMDVNNKAKAKMFSRENVAFELANIFDNVKSREGA